VLSLACGCGGPEAVVRMGGNVGKDAYAGQTVWVVGASSGIGAALAEAYYRHGARVVISARRAEELEQLARALRALRGGGGGQQAGRAPSGTISPVQQHGGEGEADLYGVAVLPFDAADTGLAEAMARQAEQLFGQVDTLVLCQGLTNRGTVLETDVSVVRRLLDVNVLSYYALSRAVLPHMTARKSGRIVVMSSVQGFFGMPSRAPYSASKHALHGMFESLSSEVGHLGVKVSIVCPGYVKTNLSRNALTTEAGKTHGKMDEATESGFEPRVFAEKALRGIDKGSEYVIVAQTSATIGIFLKRHFPSIIRSMMHRRGRKEARKSKAD
jgi:dehydrogenase/reductase SDR family protein 7B